MNGSNSAARSASTRFIAAPPEKVYQAFIDPEALTTWQAPGEMTAKLHGFDPREGGGYVMSLFYPASEPELRGKSGGREDRYTARFVELTPPSRIVEAITFDTADPAMMGEMTMIVTLTARGAGTDVTIVFANLPSGVSPEDNDAGTRSSLEKLAAYVEGQG
jgi:uncharacterized protein YndB with AHSA1/START domain